MSAEKCLAVAMLFFWLTAAGIAIGWAVNCIGIVLRERSARRSIAVRFPVSRDFHI